MMVNILDVITQGDLKFIKSLAQRKFRQKYNKFIAEGDKICSELVRVGAHKIDAIYSLNDWSEEHVTKYPRLKNLVTVVSEKELGRMSQLRSANKVLMVLDIPPQLLTSDIAKAGTVLYLADVQDPGNVGTIIRIADWYGIQHVIRSQATADFYNAKVVQATMASFANVGLHTASFEEVKDLMPHHATVGAVLGGTDINKHQWDEQSIIVMGNESKGVPTGITDQLQHKLMLPGSSERLADSLNVGIATALMCQQWYSR